MTRQEFLEGLSGRIGYLPDAERERSLSFYAESIDDRMEDGMNEEAAVASLGSIDEIVRSITIDAPLTSLIVERARESREKSGNRKLWMILAICGSPIWFPLAVTFAAVLFVIYVCIWVLVVALAAVLFSLGMVGVCGIAMGGFYIFAHGLAAGLGVLGMGLAGMGLFLLCLQPLVGVIRQLAGVTKSFMQQLKRKVLKKKEIGV